ncbi:paralemmin 1a [Gadus morhua]|uniref:paralemmin 1a n=1 Tax=Gadus morhua TaxID=8049 RepID=UPI0011B79F76|nr:paralemmin-1-like [Gadus morhua]
MEAPDVQQEKLQGAAERRRQTETEEKRRQLEQYRRHLQHIKSATLRERWLLEGAPPAGGEEERQLESCISRLEEEVLCLESGSTRPYETMIGYSVKEVGGADLTAFSDGGALQPSDGGTLQPSDGGTLQPSDGGTLQPSDGGTLQPSDGGTLQPSDGGTLQPSDGGTLQPSDGGTLQPSDGGTLQPSDGGTLQPSDGGTLQSSDGLNQRQSSAPPDSLLKAAMYSVEIRVERDRATGETRVLSSNTLLPVDLSLHGVKVYEDRTRVVHEVNGENDVQPLSFLEVEDLILKADQVSMEPHPAGPAPTHHPAGPTPTGPAPAHNPDGPAHHPAGPAPAHQPDGPAPSRSPSSGIQEVPQKSRQKTRQKSRQKPRQKARQSPVEARGPQPEAELAGASEEHPVTMVFMGYQSVEDQDQTSRVLGLEGTVTAELVLIEDNEGRTPPGASPQGPEGEPLVGGASVGGASVGGLSVGGPSVGGPSMEGLSVGGASKQTVEPNGRSLSSSLPHPKAAEGGASEGGASEGGASDGGASEGGASDVHQQEREKQPCKCCIIM